MTEPVYISNYFIFGPIKKANKVENELEKNDVMGGMNSLPNSSNLAFFIKIGRFRKALNILFTNKKVNSPGTEL